jgi:carboxypeptidase C (cathepsin A)
MVVYLPFSCVRLVDQWFTEHPDYLANPFYVGGDSYGGKLVPFLAQKISEGTTSKLCCFIPEVDI